MGQGEIRWEVAMDRTRMRSAEGRSRRRGGNAVRGEGAGGILGRLGGRA